MILNNKQPQTTHSVDRKPKGQTLDETLRWWKPVVNFTNIPQTSDGHCECIHNNRINLSLAVRRQRQYSVIKVIVSSLVRCWRQTKTGTAANDCIKLTTIRSMRQKQQSSCIFISPSTSKTCNTARAKWCISQGRQPEGQNAHHAGHP